MADALPVRVSKATVSDVPLEIEAVGTVEASERVEVKARVTGPVKRVAFTEGENVTKGQLLFTIDSDTLDRQTAEQMAELERDLATEQQARAVVVRDEAALAQSHTEEQRSRELLKEGLVSKQSADQSVTAEQTAQATLDSDKAAVAAATGLIKADHARLAQTQLQKSFTNVMAPISGRAGAAAVKAGNLVTDDAVTLVTVNQLAPIEVTFGVPEQLLSQVRKRNAEDALTVEALQDGTRYQGRLNFIDNSVDAATGTIRLKAVFANDIHALWPGEFVEVRVQLGIERARMTVPEAAVEDGTNGKYVWRVRAQSAEVVPVLLMRTYKPVNGPELAVIEGNVREGDTIVSNGQLRLTPGARLAVLGMDKAAADSSAD